MRVLYLHGFASSARSSKATFFAGKLREAGIEVQIPDLNLPDFSTLTITRMVAQVLEIVDSRPADEVVLIGSSLGAFVAVQVALARPARIQRLVLLAPALDFGPSRSSESSRAESKDGSNHMKSLGSVGLEEWKRTDRLDIFHYGYGRMMPVHYELYADATRYDCLEAALIMPIQVFQGRRDDAVDPVTVEQWAHRRPNVELHLLDDDHQLTASVERVWSEMRRFLGIGDSVTSHP